MVGTDLKAETMKLMEKRTAVEAEMNVIIERLTGPGGPGLSGNLVDSEGFPRTDIDIPVVRAERRRLSELRNDHEEITDKLNKNLQVLHSARLTPRSAPAKGSGDAVTASESSHNNIQRDTPSDMDVDVIVGRPFAVVDEIADGSPAAEDGLQLGDQIAKFGNVESGDNLLQRLSSEAQASQGHALTLLAMRQGELINLTVTPRTWHGRGLLGGMKPCKSVHRSPKCHLCDWKGRVPNDLLRLLFAPSMEADNEVTCVHVGLAHRRNALIAKLYHNHVAGSPKE